MDASQMPQLAVTCTLTLLLRSMNESEFVRQLTDDCHCVCGIGKDSTRQEKRKHQAKFVARSTKCREVIVVKGEAVNEFDSCDYIQVYSLGERDELT